MNLRSIGTCALGAAICATTGMSYAQVAGSVQSSSASHVAAEMTKGRLNPAESKPGDTVMVRLKADVKSNGEVVLKKGTSITGIVRNVKRESGGTVNGQAQSMIEVEWLPPAAPGRVAQNLFFALHSVTQLSVFNHEQESAEEFGIGGGGTASSPMARPMRVATPIGAIAATTEGIGSISSTRASGQSNPALMSMPTVMAADRQTSEAIESSLGASPAGRLFNVGHGRIVTASGSTQAVDMFSHLNNDTVITSAGKDFEISNGAEMLLLVGVNRK